MRHAKPYRKLSRQRSHYRALMRNLAFSLFQFERVRTTLAKAKEARRFVEQIITLAKSGTLADRRRAFALMGNKVGTQSGLKTTLPKDILDKVFKELGPRYASRAGGYTRIIRLGARPGDSAPMAYLELVDAKVESRKRVKSEKIDSAEDNAEAASA